MDVFRFDTAVFKSDDRFLMSVLREVLLSDISCKRDEFIIEIDVLRFETAVFKLDARLLMSVLRDVLIFEIS